MLVVGEPGIGKSRLLDELVGIARSRGITTLRGMADEHEQLPFGLWNGAGRALGVPFPGADRTLSPTDQRWELLRWLSDALIAAAPVVVVLDDLHWADDSSLWILERVAREVTGYDVAFFASSRSGVPDATDRWYALRRSADVVPLEGLDTEQVAVLLDRLGARATDPEELRDRTGGNPLFLREVAGRRSDAPIPAELSDLLLGPIEALGPDRSDTLSVLALAGRDAPPAVIAAAASRPVTEIVGHLEEALAADLLRTDEQGALWFRHALLGDAARAAARRRPSGATSTSAWRGPGSTWATVGCPAGRPAPATSWPPCPLPTSTRRRSRRRSEELAAEQIEVGRAAEAEQLLSTAVAAFAQYEPAALVDRARLDLALGDARWALGDRWLAAKTFEQADELLDVGRRRGRSCSSGPRPSPRPVGTPTRSSATPTASGAWASSSRSFPRGPPVARPDLGSPGRAGRHRSRGHGRGPRARRGRASPWPGASVIPS